MKSNNLSISHPYLIREWHPTRNGNLNPKNYSYGSHKIVWWKCLKCDGEWKAYIFNRTIHSQGCPYCSGKRVSKKNSLAVNYPDLASEWDYVKNGDLKPGEVSVGSTKKVYWVCSECDNKWPCRIRDRVRRGTRCPRCTGRITSKENPSKNCLALACPEKAAEWHPTKNGDKTPWDVTVKSPDKVWWICKVCKQEFDAIISNRTRPSRGCKYCSNKKVLRHNSLGAKYPHLEKEWDYQKNIKTPFEVAYGDDRKYFWKCEKGHSWPASPNNRTDKKSNCPFCSGRLATEERNLKVMFPEISKELHPSKNHNLNPYKITPYCNDEIWWLCKKGHEWTDTINHRTGSGRGCPDCYHQTSGPELRIYTELKTIFKKLKHRHKVFDIECDVLLPKYKLAIEYDGFPWHQNKDKIDSNKERILADNEIKLIRLRDDRLNKLKEEDILVPKEFKSVSIINDILKAIKKEVDLDKGDLQKIDVYLSKNSFQNESEFNFLMNQRKTAMPGCSFAEKCPDAVKDWDYERNVDLSPYEIGPSSSRDMRLTCPKGHSWKTKPKNLTSNGHDSPPRCSDCRKLGVM